MEFQFSCSPDTGKEIIIKYQHRKPESQEYAPTSAHRLRTPRGQPSPLVPSVSSP